jgi:hypothetical protein
MYCLYRNRIHERRISWRFLGIILRVLRLEVSMWIRFSIRFFSFLLFRNCKRLREFEEIKMSMATQSFRGDCEWEGGKFLRLLPGFRPRIWPQYSICRLSMLSLYILFIEKCSHSLAGEGVGGGPNSNEGTNTLVHYCIYPSTVYPILWDVLVQYTYIG